LAKEYVFFGQNSQFRFGPSEFITLPAGHILQSVLDVDPAFSEKAHAAQSMQAVPETTSEYVLRGQMSQVL
jgi:hypothetical protein